MVGLDDNESDEQDGTVYAVLFTLHGRACESQNAFLHEEARDAFVDLLEANDAVTNVRTYAYHDPEYVEQREEEPERMDAQVTRV